MDYYDNFKHFHYFYKFFGLNHIVIDGEPFQRNIRVSMKSSILPFCGITALFVIHFYNVTEYPFSAGGDRITDVMVSIALVGIIW